MSKDKCPCINKSDANDIRSALTTARDIYRHIIKTLSIEESSPEYLSLEERANRFNNLTYQIDKITCREEDTKREEDKEPIKYMTTEEMGELPLKERIRIAKIIASTTSQ